MFVDNALYARVQMSFAFVAYPVTIRAQILIDHGADKNCLDKSKESPLHLAANNVCSLVSCVPATCFCCSIEPNEISHARATKPTPHCSHVVAASVAQGHSEVTYLLIRSGAKLNGRDKKYGNNASACICPHPQQ